MKLPVRAAGLFALLSLIGATPAFAASESATDKAAEQEGSEAIGRDSAFPKFERFRLSNGIEVWFVERHAEQSLSMQMVVETGIDRQFRTRLPGTQSLVAALLHSGTQTRTEENIAENLQSMSSKLLVGGDSTSLLVRLDVPSADLSPMIDLWAEVVRRPSFPEKKFGAAKEDYLRYIRDKALLETKQTSTAAIEQTLWGTDHPYSKRATISSVSKIKAKDLRAFHRRWFGPNNARIIAVGDTTVASLQNKLEQVFRDWPRAPGNPLRMPTQRRLQAARVIFIDHPGAPVTYIRVASSIPPFDPKHEVARGLFNSAFGLRLNENLADIRHVSNAFSSIPSSANSRALVVTAPVKNENIREAITEIRHEFTRVRAEPLTDKEIASVKESWAKSYHGRWQTNAAILDGLESLARYGLPATYWDSYLSEIRSQSTQDVRAAGIEMIPDDCLAWVFAGDISAIEQDVRSLNLGAVEVWNPDGRRIR